MWSAAHEGVDQAAEIIRQTYYADELEVKTDNQGNERIRLPAPVSPKATLALFKTPTASGRCWSASWS